MINPPKPDREGKVQFEEKKGKGAGNQIDKYPIAQTISNLNEKVLDKYNIEKDMAKANGTSKTAAEGAAQAMAKKLPEFTAVQHWLDNEAEIDLKKALVKRVFFTHVKNLTILRHWVCPNIEKHTSVSIFLFQNKKNLS